MAATTMHFGPEWMRAKPQPCPPRQQPSPPPQPPLQLGPASYSALVTPLIHQPHKRDESRPFRYTKDEMLKIYKEGGGRGGLGLEVERWEGIVRDVATDPAALRELTEAEKKLFAGPLNSELRRRQSTDLMNTLSSADRQRLIHPNSAANNNTVRYGPFSSRRRDSTDQPPLALPRKLSLSNTQGTALTSPRDALPSPRNRIGAFGTGFDGVLNSGDSWSRRRPSTSATGAGNGVTARVEGKDEDTRHSEIKEEEESTTYHSSRAHDGEPAAVMDISSSHRPGVSPSDPASDGQVSSLEFDSLGRNTTGLSLEAQHQSVSNLQAPPTKNIFPSGSPPGQIDPSSIEWSYLDPQGQVQGPFRADLMQKWFDEGYFTPDLLMKRTHIDVDWIAVGILEDRAAGGKIFLPQVPNGPPGLAIRSESPKSYSPVHEQNAFNGYQPIPTQTLRTTLDSLNGISPIDSPSSSLGGGRFGNGSPDPSAFGGRTHTGRAAFHDTVSDSRIFGNNVLARAPTIDTLNVYNGGGDGSPWSTGPGQIGQGFNDNEHPYPNGFNGSGSGMMGNPLPAHHVHGINQEHYANDPYGGIGSLGSHYDSPAVRQPSDVTGMPFDGNMVNGLGSQFGVPSQFSQSPSASYPVPQQHPSISPFGDLLPQTTDASNVTQTPSSAIQPNNASPWITRSRTFEPPAVPSPAVPPARPQATEWKASQPAQPADPSPWLMASLPIVDDVWREMPGPNSLTFSNLGQHNRLQEEVEGVDDVAISPIRDVVVPSPNTQSTQIESMDVVSASSTNVVSHSVPQEVNVVSSTPDVRNPTASKARRKSTARDVQASAPKIPPPVPGVVKDQPPTPTHLGGQPKPVWAVEDDSKKQSGAMISLREIQEAEAKKVEARKAAEKERERVIRANATGGNVTVEENPPFTSSWGLPTSQAGVRTQIPIKDISTINSTPASSAVPVWTNAASPSTAKKTMKEIQEEEERRKKLVVKESMASAAARRAYADTTLKVVPSVQVTGGSWTTVGPNGKPTPAATSTPRPPASTSPISATPTTITRTNGVATRQAAATTVKVATPRVEDFSIAPSHEFLRWLGESLKGLNSSVNLEEMTSMLLSFPLDPDPSTLEIISDLIYANSTTLDGRRFASEYVNKRKADAATRRGTTGALGPSSKLVSIADVVKTQPKPVQQEWGFKVVNKKKKGGRS